MNFKLVISFSFLTMILLRYKVHAELFTEVVVEQCSLSVRVPCLGLQRKVYMVTFC